VITPEVLKLTLSGWVEANALAKDFEEVLANFWCEDSRVLFLN